MFEFIIGLPVGGIIGWIVREVISDKLSRDRAIAAIKAAELNKAIGDFRGTFAPAIAKFPLLSDANKIDAMLREELIPQSVAIERFRPFVRPDKKDAYQKAWDQYHQSHKRNGVSSVYFLDYAVGDEKERFKFFNERIHAILLFAE